jgi:23S rRNA pseudouridine1911/1915/1917 synthase
LDKDTSGVILLAKTPEALANLINQFSERKLEKQYLALVHGRPTLLSGSIRVPLGRHPTNRVRMSVREEEGGRPARTDWAVEERFGSCATRLRCWLHTGRTHQIRVHLAHIGHPLLGDATYTLKNIPPNRALPPAARVMLHAERISFFHPITNLPLRILAPIPSDFLDVQEELRSRFGGDRIMPTPT